MSASIETELKLQLDPTAFNTLLADPKYFSEAAVTRYQVSTYFDTPLYALRRAGLSLRIRRIGDRRIQTVKAESAATASLFARAEWERDIAGDAPEIDGMTEKLSHALAESRDGGIAPIFVISVTRTSIVLKKNGSQIEMVADRGVITAGDHTVAISEIELELLDGDPADLFVVAREIAVRVPFRLGLRSKSERGYGLVTGEMPVSAVKAEAVRLTSDMPAGEAFAVVVNACLRHFRANEDMVLVTQAPEPLHQARVALRRLRSALSIFRPLIKGVDADRLKAELQWISSLFGEVRNVDVMIGRIDDEQALRKLRRARRQHHARLSKALSSRRMRILTVDLAEWISVGAWWDDDAVAELRASSISVFAGQVLDRLRRRIKRGGRRLEDIDEDARHEVRILAKKLRYSGEFFAGLYPAAKARRRHDHFLAAINKLQSALGDLNDLAIGRALLADLGVAEGETLLAATGKHKPGRLLAKAQNSLDDLIEIKRFWR